MSKQIEALKLALEALKTIDEAMPFPVAKLAQAAIKEALAQPEQEPRNIRERWNIEIDGDDLLVCLNDHEKSEGCHYERYVPATTAPPKRKPLTSKEIRAIEVEVAMSNSFAHPTKAEEFVRAIEAAHGIRY